jgi:hypothetical protein
MARDRQRGRKRQAEAVPVAEPVVEVEPAGGGGRGKIKDRPVKIPTGPSFAMPIAVGAGALAAVLAFGGSMVVGKLTAPDPLVALDDAGVQAVRFLSIMDINRWQMGFGTSKLVRARVAAEINRRIEEVKASGDERDLLMIEEPIKEWRAGVDKEGVEWRPGFDQFFPPDDTQVDAEIEVARLRGFKRIAALTGPEKGAFVGAAVTDVFKKSIVSAGTFFKLDKPIRRVGDTEVYALAGMRAYRHPMYDRAGDPAGSALVVLSAANAQAPELAAPAGAAAACAFLGAFVLVFVMGTGVVKTVRLLATDAESLAAGDFETRVHVRGPDIVQAAQKNLQKVAHMAAEGTGPSEPQIVTQQVHVLPVQDIHEGLGPMKGFQRPAELEVEGTAKICPESGNDYFDVVNVDEDHCGFLVADVPVKGVRGAIYMASVRAIFRAEARKSSSPAEVLKAVNRAFAVDLPRGVYVTAMYAVVNKNTGVCRVASAQHLPLVFWKLSKKGSARLQTEGIALGLDSGSVFDKALEEKAVQLDKGDRIVLYTDGAITAKNAAGAKYGEERFYYVVNREAPKNSAAFVNFVANDVDLYHDGAPQLDDFTILTVRRVK